MVDQRGFLCRLQLMQPAFPGGTGMIHLLTRVVFLGTTPFAQAAIYTVAPVAHATIQDAIETVFKMTVFRQYSDNIQQ
jgi:hypothetical protein